MNPLTLHRERLNLTQKELAEQSGISIRTIQRIEAGDLPKGYTLKTLAKALAVSENELLGKNESVSANKSLIKYINLISLPFMIVPPLNIVAPLLLMYYKKEWTAIARQLVSIQILWLLASIILSVIGLFVKRIFDDYDSATIVIICVALALNSFVILRNGFELAKSNKLYFSLNVNLI